MKFVCNFLTILRLFCVPIIIVCFFTNQWASFFIFLLACTTDYLDGKIARKYNCTSDFGKILDPITDKVLIITALIALFTINSNIFIPGLIIIWREIIINDLRFTNNSIQSSLLSKIKTTFQMIAIGILLLPQQTYVNVEKLGLLMLWIAAALSVISAIYFFIKK